MPDRAAVIKELVERIEATLAVGSEWVNVPLDLVQYAVHMLEEQEETDATIDPCGSCQEWTCEDCKYADIRCPRHEWR